MSEEDISEKLMPLSVPPDYSTYVVQLPMLLRELKYSLADKRFSKSEEVAQQMVQLLQSLVTYLKGDYQDPALHPVVYVRTFHEMYGHPIRTVPTVPSAKERLLRVRLIGEEYKELAKASGFPVEIVHGNSMLSETIPLTSVTPEMSEDKEIDLAEVADGCGDLNVVVNGTALTWGIPIAEVDAEIHRSNMSKLGLDGKPLTDAHGKTLKGPRYFPPDIKSILRRSGWV